MHLDCKTDHIWLIQIEVEKMKFQEELDFVKYDDDDDNSDDEDDEDWDDDEGGDGDGEE